MSTITATTTTTTVTGDTSGTLVFAVGSGPTTVLTLGTDQKATLGVGMSTPSPLTIPSGTLKTSPAAGDIEYDGYALYATPTTGQRGAVPTNSQYVSSGAVGGPSTTTAFPIASGTNGGIQILANVVYLYEFWFYATNNGTATISRRIFVKSGDAIINSSGFAGVHMYAASNSAATSWTGSTGISANSFFGVDFNTSSGTVSQNATSTGPTVTTVVGRGALRSTTGGYLITTYVLNTSVGTAYSTAAASISVTPLGYSASNTFSIGSYGD